MPFDHYPRGIMFLLITITAINKWIWVDRDKGGVGGDVDEELLLQ